MDKLTALSAPLRLWLQTHGGAGLAFPALVIATFLVMYGLRKWAPSAKLLEKIASFVPALSLDMTPGLTLINKAVQALVPTLFTTTIGALASGGNVEVALVSATAGPVAALSHELLKWLPFIPYVGQVHPAALAKMKRSTHPDDDDNDHGSPFASSKPPSSAPSVPPPAAAMSGIYLFARNGQSFLRSSAGAVIAFCLVAFCGACVGLTPQDKAAGTTIQSIAKELCLLANAESHATLTTTEVVSTFCTTDAQLTPFINQLLAAKAAAMAPPALAADAGAKAAPLTGCAAALERGKALSCPIDDPDAGGWCSALSAKDVQCLSSATSCRVYARCTTVSQ